MIREPNAQAKLLNQFYDTIFHPDNGQPTPTLPFPSVKIGIPVFSPCPVHKQLSNFDS